VEIANACWLLDNGLRIHAASDPAATCAAALVRVEAGSFQEPTAWPGLAHLLEHMLFRGSANFAAEDSLIAWAQSVGGRVNATTQTTQTALFFEAGSEHLADGLARLSDMLAAPRLTAGAVKQEIEVIDAEYHLLRTDAETCCEAAQRHMFSGIDALHRFHIGSRAAFGDNTPALQRALRQFHRRYFRAPAMTLWLHGPQPLEALHTLATRYGNRFIAGNALPQVAAPPLVAEQDYTLSLPGAPQLRLVFALQPFRSRSWLRRLERLLLDEAPGGLLARLRAQACCDAVRLDYLRCSENSALLSFIFTVNSGSAHEAANIESALLAWLGSLRDLTPAQLEHYRQLANRDVKQRAPLDQLRAKAFGLPPAEQHDGWRQHIAALIVAPRRRLAVRPEGGGEKHELQGLPLVLGPFTNAAAAPAAEAFHFFSSSALPPMPVLPADRAPLRHLLPGDAQPVLLLYPAWPAALTDEHAGCMQVALRAVAAELAHRDGHVSVERHQGIWLLQLTGSEALICHGLSLVNRALAELTPAMRHEAARNQRRARLAEQYDIAIRRLLAQLPAALNASPEPMPNWHATLVGGDEALQQRLAHLLSDFPCSVTAERLMPSPRQHHPVILAESGSEHALLQFYPLANNEAEGRWALRVLAQLYAPRYFQRLRVEHNIGYVVQCALYRSGEVEGLLFALQSPTFSVEQLQRFTNEFLLNMQHTLATLEVGELNQIQQRVRQNVRQLSAEPLQRAREIALENRMPLEHVSLLSLTQLQYWQQRLHQSIKLL